MVVVHCSRHVPASFAQVPVLLGLDRDDGTSLFVPRFDKVVRLGSLRHGKALVDERFYLSRLNEPFDGKQIFLAILALCPIWSSG
jgi:hypothetical protein